MTARSVRSNQIGSTCVHWLAIVALPLLVGSCGPIESETLVSTTDEQETLPADASTDQCIDATDAQNNTDDGTGVDGSTDLHGDTPPGDAQQDGSAAVDASPDQVGDAQLAAVDGQDGRRRQVGRGRWAWHKRASSREHKTEGGPEALFCPGIAKEIASPGQLPVARSVV